MNTKTVALLQVRAVRSRRYSALPLPVRGYRATWATLTGGEIYRSVICRTPERARELALLWMQKRDGVYETREVPNV